MIKNTFIKAAIFLFLFSILFFISSRDKENYVTGSYRSTLFVDPAGYNVYLPATFQHSFINNFPDNMDYIVAYGFHFDKDKKVITKFTYGVALLQSPFYILGLGVSKLFGIENTGYSYFNHLLIDIAGITYACLGLMLLYFTLSKYYSKIISFTSSLIIFVGTNTLYYASIQPGMSHIYSFFLVVTALHFFIRYLENSSFKFFILFSLTASLIILIRPTNVVLILPILLFNVNGVDQLKLRLKRISTLKNCIAFSIIFILLFIPQSIYWKFAYGSYIADSYPGEGFTYLTHPQIRRFLFSPHNGLLAYSPLYLLLFFASILLLKNYKSMAYAYLLTTGLIIYLSSSWHVYFFGCGFGARNFVEFSGLLAFPLASGLTNGSKKYQPIAFGILIACTVFVNIKLMYNWDLCFSGKNDWDWTSYKYAFKKPQIELEQDLNSIDPAKIVFVDNQKAYRVDSLDEYPPGFEIDQKKLPTGKLSATTVSVDIMPLDKRMHAQLCFMIKEKDSVMVFHSSIMSGPPGKWTTISHNSQFNYFAEEDKRIQIFIMNSEKNRFYFKNLKAELE